MRGSGLVGGRVDGPGGAFFIAWTLLALGVTALFSVTLSARGLWGLPWRRPRQSDHPDTGRPPHGGRPKLPT